MDKVKILVACHKSAKVYQDDVYTPIQVGKALHPDLDLGYITDDTGDNISAKNGNYSELTAQYWAWKNMHNVEYVGLCHYRRYFLHRITADNVDHFLGNNADVIQVAPLTTWMNLGERLIMSTSQEDFYIFYKSFAKVHPEDIETFREFVTQNSFSPFNMFVMKKDEFDKFAEWQFSIFVEMEKYVKLSNYGRQMRLYGYLSEILLSLYIKINHLKVIYDGIIDNERIIPYTPNLRYCIHNLKINISFCLSHGFRKKERTVSGDFRAVEIGLNQIGVNL